MTNTLKPQETDDTLRECSIQRMYNNYILQRQRTSNTIDNINVRNEMVDTILNRLDYEA